MKFSSRAKTKIKLNPKTYNALDPKNTSLPARPGKGIMEKIAIIELMKTSSGKTFAKDKIAAKIMFAIGPAIAILEDSDSVNFLYCFPNLNPGWITIAVENAAAKNIWPSDKRLINNGMKIPIGIFLIVIFVNNKFIFFGKCALVVNQNLFSFHKSRIAEQPHLFAMNFCAKRCTAMAINANKENFRKYVMYNSVFG